MSKRHLDHLVEDMIISKRPRKEASKTDQTFAPPIQEQQSPFFRLPRELRDQIYTYSLSTGSTTFQHNGLTLLATTSFPTTTCRPSPSITTGLPSWLQTNKQMCSEALEIFSQTRMFTALRFDKREDTFDHWPVRRRKRVLLNPLVVTGNVIGQIVVARRLARMWGYAGATGKFLRVLSALDPRDMCLVTEWVRVSREAGWVTARGREEEDFDGWNPFWDGRFRQVTIVVEAVVSAVVEAGTLAALDVLAGKAEVCAKRLVGEGGEVGWEDEERRKKGGVFWGRRCVIVERKT